MLTFTKGNSWVGNKALGLNVAGSLNPLLLAVDSSVYSLEVGKVSLRLSSLGNDFRKLHKQKSGWGFFVGFFFPFKILCFVFTFLFYYLKNFFYMKGCQHSLLACHDDEVCRDLSSFQLAILPDTGFGPCPHGQRW